MDSDPKVAENRLLEILPDGAAGVPVRLPLAKPFPSYFTTTVRGGSPTSRTLEMLDPREKIQPATMQTPLAFCVVKPS